MAPMAGPTNTGALGGALQPSGGGALVGARTKPMPPAYGAPGKPQVTNGAQLPAKPMGKPVRPRAGGIRRPVRGGRTGLGQRPARPVM